MQWQDAVRRTVRTFLQAFIGTFLSLIVVGGNSVNDGYVPSYDAWEKAAIAALFSAIIAALTLVQNLLEDTTGVALLKPKDREVGDAVLNQP